VKVLLLRANPRKTGYSQRVTDWFARGVQEAGAVVQDVDLTALALNPCLGCYHCWVVTPGQCVHADGMSPLLEDVLAAEVLVCATPLYFFSMSASLKTFFERTLPLMREGLEPSAGGRLRNRCRFPQRWHGKSLISLVTGAMRDPGGFSPLEETFRALADGTGLEFGGQLIRPESALLDYPLSKPRTLKTIETAFVQAGREAGICGRLSQETIRQASLPLAVDQERFLTYSNIYWGHVTAMGEQGLDAGRVRNRVGCDVHILMREMVRTLDPRATARVRALLAFEFPDAALAYRVLIDRGQCVLSEGTAAHPDLRVRCQPAVWGQIFTRQMDVREALRRRELVLEGDKSLFTRLDRFFPPPSA
jgi:putative NADPH-quinone reductase